MPPQSPLSHTPPARRWLLCACPAHCAQVLRAAAQQRVPLHGLQPCTTWPWEGGADIAANPTASAATDTVLWALLPPDAPAAAQAREAAWRQRLHSGHLPAAVQMLYGTAAQQAQQLAPWMVQPARPAQAATAAGHQPDACWECLDATSEQQLFRHLTATAIATTAASA